MGKKIYRILILAIIFTFSRSSLLAIEPVVLSEGKEEYALGTALEYLEDAGGSWNIGQVSSADFNNKFIKNTKEVPNFGFTRSRFWGRFKIKNSTVTFKESLIEISYPHLDEIEFYIFDGAGKMRSQKTGRRLPFSQRQIKDRFFLIPLNLEPSSEKYVYFRIETGSVMQFPVKVWLKNAYIEKVSSGQYIMGLYYGIMIVMIIYNLFVFLSIRDKSYLYYIFFVLGFSMFQITLNGYSYQFFSYFNAWTAEHGLPTFIGFTGMWMCFFTNDYLKLAAHARKLYFTINGFTGLFFISIFLSLFLPYRLTVQITAGLAMAGMALLITAGTVSLIKNYRPARYYMLAFITLLVGAIIYGAMSFGLLPSTFVTIYAIQIGSALEVTLLSLGLADRINIMKLETEKAQREAMTQLENNIRLKEEWTRELEIQVQDRTAELQSANETLAGQKKEIESIVEAAVTVQKSPEVAHIAAGIGSYLQKNFGLDAVAFFIAGRDAKGSGKTSVKLGAQYPAMALPKGSILMNQVFPQIARQIFSRKQLGIYSFDLEKKQYDPSHFNPGEVSYFAEPYSDSIPCTEDGQNASDFSDKQKFPEMLIAVPLIIETTVAGMMVCISNGSRQENKFQSSPEMLFRLSRLLAAPIYHGEMFVQEVRKRNALQADNQKMQEEIQSSGRQLDGIKSDFIRIKQDLSDAQEQLTQAEKMSTLGQMVAGVAHEISNPANYIMGSNANLKSEIKNFEDILKELIGSDPEAQEVAQDFAARFEKLRSYLDNIQLGVEKVTQINGALRNFSRMDALPLPGVNLSETMDETLVILTSRIKRHKVERRMDGLPTITCRPSHLSQVFTNIIANASDAIDERIEKEKRNGNDYEGRILISGMTESKDGKEGIAIYIEDNGPGVPDDLKEKILKAFFTTKPPGKGTGLGLAISGKIITNHQGDLSILDSKNLGGACFRIWLPLSGDALEI